MNEYEQPNIPAAKKAAKKVAKKKAAPKKKAPGKKVGGRFYIRPSEQAQVDFYMAMVDRLTGKSSSPRPDAVKNEFDNISEAYRSFAQNNVSKSRGFDSSVAVSNGYQNKLNELLGK